MRAASSLAWAVRHDMAFGTSDSTFKKRDWEICYMPYDQSNHKGNSKIKSNNRKLEETENIMPLAIDGI